MINRLRAGMLIVADAKKSVCASADVITLVRRVLREENRQYIGNQRGNWIVRYPNGCEVLRGARTLRIWYNQV